MAILAIVLVQSMIPLVCRDDSEMPSVTNSSEVEKVPLITQFFSRKSDLTSEMRLGTKRLATTEHSAGIEVQSIPVLPFFIPENSAPVGKKNLHG